MTDQYRIVPAAYILFRRERDGVSEVLLQLRDGTGYMDGHWALAAAGHVEAAESVIAAACREVTEELGVTVQPGELAPLCVMHRSGGTGDAIDERADFFFECWDWFGEPRIVEPHKAADLRWFALGALPEPVVPHELSVLEHVRKGDVPRILTRGFSE
ncbi:NUDIX domain-containing protein [Phytoactinopolyspora alkaliphila]|uniref:NUDIX domain-containing protein n=1 Tax=Phytoactinopolyspora alkaliphila TaxID=1783498 RepID=A0A6N9YML5_9ACTN|nr:NUDIX domain-containing protein [Phytoactinopolyspora alkaliphila]